MTTINLLSRSTRNATNGQWLKNIEPHNKGKKWDDWMPKKMQKKVIKNLHRNGNPNFGGTNKIKIVGIKNGRFCPFESSKDAERKLGICARNIRTVCKGQRKFAGGWQWFYENSNEWLNLIENL